MKNVICDSYTYKLFLDRSLHFVIVLEHTMTELDEHGFSYIYELNTNNKLCMNYTCNPS